MRRYWMHVRFASVAAVVVLAVGFVQLHQVAMAEPATNSGSNSSTKKDDKPDICDPNTMRFKTTALSSPTDKARAAKALANLRGLMQPIRNAGDGSTITAAKQYGTDYTGEIKGSFQLKNSGSYATGNPTPLSVTSPSSVPGTYRGKVSGKAPTGGSRVVKAFRATDAEYEQGKVTPAQVQSDGSWTLDLSPVDGSIGGEWRFRLYDASSGQPLGESWPRVTEYQNVEIQSYVITDQTYLVAKQAANTNRTFSFPGTEKGHKMLRLVDTRSNKILAEYFQPQLAGLIRSYEFSPGQDGYGTHRVHYSFMYDQSLALLVAVGAGDKAMADQLVNGFKTIQIKSGRSRGAFPSSAHQLDPSNQQARYYTGGVAFVLYALIRYQEKFGDINGVSNMVRSALAWVKTKKSTSGPGAGLYRGGTNINDDDNNKQFEIAWHSTEHNTDLWHVYERASQVYGDASYRQEADSLAKVIMEKLWNKAENRFDQGLDDHAKALDTSSWGSIFLNAIGEYDKAKVSLAYTRNFAMSRAGSQGYTPYLTGTYTPTVWFEGTFGVTQAYNVAGNKDEVAASAQRTYRSQGANGAWPYVTNVDEANQMTNAYSVASTAWYLLATAYPDAIWSECRTDKKPDEKKQPPMVRHIGKVTLDKFLAGEDKPLWVFILISLLALLVGIAALILYLTRRYRAKNTAATQLGSKDNNTPPGGPPSPSGGSGTPPPSNPPSPSGSSASGLGGLAMSAPPHTTTPPPHRSSVSPSRGTSIAVQSGTSHPTSPRPAPSSPPPRPPSVSG